jgi:hypothetical protein
MRLTYLVVAAFGGSKALFFFLSISCIMMCHRHIPRSGDMVAIMQARLELFNITTHSRSLFSRSGVNVHFPIYARLSVLYSYPLHFFVHFFTLFSWENAAGSQSIA